MLLIDGDQFLFKSCAAVEREIRWDDQNHVLYSNSEAAWKNLVGMIDRIKERFPDHSETPLCFSAGENFRKKLDPTYKANRDPRKPLCYALLRERTEEEYDCLHWDGLEADDVMGIMATHPREAKSPQGVIIVSQDKDMKTIPTSIWDGEHLVTYTEGEADYWHFYQTLMGDTSDGYKGCPGIGPKKAEALLNAAMEATATMWPAVVAAYEKAGLCEDDAILQARLARILRYSDWDAKTKQPKLWSPP